MRLLSILLLVLLSLTVAVQARPLPEGVAWMAQLPGYAGAPVASGGVVVLAAGGEILAFAQTDGSLRWRRALPEADVQTELREERGILVVRPSSREILALRAGDGALLWRDTAGSSTPLQMAQGWVWVLTEGRVRALDPATGQVRFQLPQEIRARWFHLYPGLLCFGDDQGLGAWDLKEGRGRWYLRQPLREVEPLVDEVLLVQPPRGPALLYDARQGALLRPCSGFSYQVVGGRWIRQGPGDLMALVEARSGREVWRRRGRGQLYQAGASWLLAYDDRAELLDPATGLVRRRLKGRFPGAVARDVLLYSDGSGRLVAVDCRSGDRVALYQGLPLDYWSDFEGAARGSQGRVFLSAQGMLLALGRGPGQVHLLGQPELSLQVDSPQVPPRVRVTVAGPFLGAVRVEAFRLKELPLAEGRLDLARARPGPRVASSTLTLNSGFQSGERSVALGLPGPGLYLLEARYRGLVQRQLLQASTLAMLVKTCPGRAFFCFQEVAGGRPVAGVKVQLYAGSETQGRRPAGGGTSGPDGTLSLSLPEGREFWAVAFWRGQVLDLAFEGPGRALQQRIYLYTDRPLYRPGQTVHFRGIVMSDQGGSLSVASGMPLHVEIRDSADNILLSQGMTSDAYGAFSGSLTLGPEPPLGRYRLAAAAGPDSGQVPFEVQEYRKPDFQLEARPARPLAVAGQRVPIEVHATYWFGGPVAGASVRYTVHRMRLYGLPSGVEEELFEEARGWRSYEEYLTEGSLQLDAQGQATLDLATEPQESDFLYLVRLEATGPGGRPVQAAASVTVAQGDFGVYVFPLSWVLQAGEKALVRLRTVDRLGKPHAARVRLDFYEVRYDRQGRRRQVLVNRQQVATGPDGEGVAAWVVGRGGYYILRGVAVDSGGRVVQGQGSFWALAKGQDGGWSEVPLKLIPDRRTFRPGQTARVLLLTSRPGRVLLTLEGNRLYQHRWVQVKGRATMLSIPIRAEHSPSLYVAAAMLVGQETVTDQVGLAVPDSQHALQVEVDSTAADYRPQDRATLRLRATHQGKPVQAQFSLGLVDEALYALRGELAAPIHRFFYGPRSNRVATLRLVPQRARVAGFQTVAPQAQVRRKFEDTAYWQADILTDETGQASVSFSLPDNLTTWRATARGVSREAAVGEATHRLVTRLPLMVQALAPRFLVEGDEARVRALVTNRTGSSARVSLSLTARGASLSQGQQTLTVAEGASEAAEATVTVPDPAASPLLLQVQARGNGQEDAEEVPVPVLPFGLRRDLYRAGLASAPLSQSVEIPQGALLPVLRVRATGSLAGVIAGSLDYLTDYPYGCVEQTLSRFLPTVIAVRAMRSLGLQDPERELRVEPMVAQGLQKLYAFQHSDGGWGWWSEDPTHPFMTGYVLYGLARAREAGYSVSETVLQRGVAAARQLLSSSQDTDTRVYLAWALTMAGAPPAEELATLAGQDSLSTSSQALLVQALERSGQEAAAAGLLGALRGAARSEGPGVFWPARTLGPHGWSDDDVEVTCLAVQALLEAEARDPLAEKGILWLLARRRGAAWKSTRDTALAVLAMTDYLQATGQARLGGSVRVLVDGRAVLSAEEGAGREACAVLSDLSPGPHRVEILPTGAAPYSLELGWMERSGGALAAEEHGLALSRSYEVLGSPSGPAQPGERVQVTLTFRNADDLGYVVLEDPRPAGLEPLPEEGSETRGDTWWTRREDRDQKTVFFFTHLPAGQHTVRYLLRAETPGRYRSLPARLWLMYRPEVWATSASAPFEVASP